MSAELRVVIRGTRPLATLEWEIDRLELSNALALDDMLLEWGCAELFSPRFSVAYADISTETRSKVASGRAVTASERSAIVGTVRWARGPLLDGLLRLDPVWRACTLGQEELGALRTVNLPTFVVVAPSRRLDDLVVGLKRGLRSPHDEAFAAGFQSLRNSEWQPGPYRPILVTQDAAKVPFIMEGYTRLAVLAARAAAGVRLARIHVILGTCPRLAEWKLSSGRQLI